MADPRPNTIAEFIERRQQQILERWVARLRETGLFSSLEPEAIADALMEFLEDIVRALRNEPEGREHPFGTKRSDAATEHGAQRFELGRDLGMMIREYGTLRDVIYQLIGDEAGEVSLQELGELSNLLLGGICDAAVRFSAARDDHTKQKSAEHVGFVAHELRNPLASAQMALSLMKSKGEIAPESRLGGIVERNLTRIGEMTGDSMMGARLEGGGILQKESIDVGDLLNQLVNESGSDVEAKHLAVDMAAGAGATVNADRKVLGSAFSNLIRNAVKFTREGRVIRVRVNRDDHDVTVEIEDECGGIPPTRLEAIFDPFVQIGGDRSGFGLGLAIAKQAVESCGGSLGVRNLPGKGCVFSVELPARSGTEIG